MPIVGAVSEGAQHRAGEEFGASSWDAIILGGQVDVSQVEVDSPQKKRHHFRSAEDVDLGERM